MQSSAVTLRFLDVEDALDRLVDLDRVGQGMNPLHFEDLRSILPDVAVELYAQSLDHALADFCALPDAVASRKALRVVAYCVGRQSLQGLESLFLSSMSVLQAHGP